MCETTGSRDVGFKQGALAGGMLYFNVSGSQGVGRAESAGHGYM